MSNGSSAGVPATITPAPAPRTRPVECRAWAAPAYPVGGHCRAPPTTQARRTGPSTHGNETDMSNTTTGHTHPDHPPMPLLFSCNNKRLTAWPVAATGAATDGTRGSGCGHDTQGRRPATSMFFLWTRLSTFGVRNLGGAGGGESGVPPRIRPAESSRSDWTSQEARQDRCISTRRSSLSRPVTQLQLAD